MAHHQEAFAKAMSGYMMADDAERKARERKQAERQKATDAIADMAKSMLASTTGTTAEVAAVVMRMKVVMEGVMKQTPDAAVARETPASTMVSALMEVRALEAAAAAAADKLAEAAAEEHQGGDHQDNEGGEVILSSTSPLETLFGASFRAQERVKALTQALQEGHETEEQAGAAREELRAAEAECAAATARYEEARQQAEESPPHCRMATVAV